MKSYVFFGMCILKRDAIEHLNRVKNLYVYSKEKYKI